MTRRITDELLTTVATLRAAGRTWEAIALEVKRPASRLRAWPCELKSRWDRAFAAAEKDQERECVAESRTALRKLLRTEDDHKLVKDAAATLLRARAKPVKAAAKRKKPVSVAALKLAEYVEGLSDAELDTELRRLAETAADAAVEAVPDAAGQAPPPLSA